MEAEHRQQISSEQMKALVDFMKKHPGLAKGAKVNMKGKLTTAKIWDKCAEKLNSLEGPSKDGKGWSKHWADWKYRLKKKAFELKKSHKKNSSAQTQQVTDLEKSILDLIGEKDLLVDKKSSEEEDENEDEDQEDNNDEDEDDDDDDNYEPEHQKGKRRRPSPEFMPAHNNNYDCASSSVHHGPIKLRKVPRRPPVTSYDAARFLDLENEQLENSKSVADSLDTIAVQLTRLVDVIGDIKDILSKHKSSM